MFALKSPLRNALFLLSVRLFFLAVHHIMFGINYSGEDPGLKMVEMVDIFGYYGKEDVLGDDKGLLLVTVVSGYDFTRY